MNKDTSHPARKGIILFITFILVAAVAYVGLIFSLFKPYYKVEIDNIFLGYYQSQEEYQKVFDKIVNEKYENDYETTKYFSKEPCFEKIYAKPKYVEQFNNYELIKTNISKDYTIYKIVVNNETQMYTKTNERAEQIIEALKKEVKAETTFSIEKETISDLTSITTQEECDEIQKKIIEANKKVVITSRGGSARSNNKGYLWPTTSKTITAYFGASGSRWSSTHTGLDIGVPSGSNIMASKGGTVVYSGWNGSYGYYVKIDHGNGIITAYAHNSRLLVSAGDKVKQGDIIALSGSTGNSTGPHLHFEVIVNGSFKNPLNYL
jgi:murein DD-endopeptidase MepM/ murein hydrolase activator NlpD